RRRGRGPRGRDVRRSWWAELQECREPRAGDPGYRISGANAARGFYVRSAPGRLRAGRPPSRPRDPGTPSVVLDVLVVGLVRGAGDGHGHRTGQLHDRGDEIRDGEAAVEPDVHHDQLLVLVVAAVAVLDRAGEPRRGRDREDVPQHPGAVGVGDPR